MHQAYILLLIQCLRYKGPSGKELWFNGYREQNMLGVFITLWCVWLACLCRDWLILVGFVL